MRCAVNGAGAATCVCVCVCVCVLRLSRARACRYVGGGGGRGGERDVPLRAAGFLATATSGFESKGGRDLTRLLQEHLEKVEAAGKGEAEGERKVEVEGEGERKAEGEAAGGAGGVSAALAAELAELREGKGEGAQRFRYQRISNGVLWVPMPSEGGAGDAGAGDGEGAEGEKQEGASAAAVGESLVAALEASRSSVSRFLLRFFPISTTCYASKDEIIKAAAPLVAEALPEGDGEGVPYAVVFEARSNGAVRKQRMDIIDELAKSVPARHKVNLDNPDVAIVCQVIKGTALLGVCRRFKAREKYNLQSLGTPPDLLEEQRELQRKEHKEHLAAKAAALASANETGAAAEGDSGANEAEGDKGADDAKAEEPKKEDD